MEIGEIPRSAGVPCLFRSLVCGAETLEPVMAIDLGWQNGGRTHIRGYLDSVRCWLDVDGGHQCRPPRQHCVCRHRSGADCGCRSFCRLSFDIYCRRLPMPLRLCRCHTCLPPLRGHQCHCHHSHRQPFCFSKREKEWNESEKRVGVRVE